MDTAAFKTLAEAVSLAIDAAGALVIVAGIAWALARWVRAIGAAGADAACDPYRRLRQDVGRGILLGLEFMVAGDIIRTVAVEPTLDSVVVLGAIVLIRTFLSFSLEVELEGRWPWRQGRSGPAPRT
jgi:uncharacterized membrane protein